MANDPVYDHFKSCLKTKRRNDGNVIPDIAKGDCCMRRPLRPMAEMVQATWPTAVPMA